MKFILAAIIGFLVGYQLGRRAMGAPEATGDAAGQGRRLLDSATRAGLGAVQRARTSIQGQLAGNGNEAWD